MDTAVRSNSWYSPAEARFGFVPSLKGAAGRTLPDTMSDYGITLPVDREQASSKCLDKGSVIELYEHVVKDSFP